MYKIIFEDNSIFKGGKPNNSKWLQIPDKLIKSIEYKYQNYTIILEGYKEYCHQWKRAIAIMGNFDGMVKVILSARDEKETIQFIWDLIKREFYTATTEIDKEYNGKKITGWKKGLSSQIPTYKIIQR